MTQESYKAIANNLAQIIKGTVWEGHVYLVGGCVRDEIMQHEIHDVDIAVDIVNGGIRFARWLEKKKHTAKGRESLQIFMHFGTAKVKLKMFPSEVIDCVQTRKDKYVYEEHPRPEYNFGSVYEDAIRRDLTINSLYVNVSTGELLDPTGMGLQDIKDHVIRTPNVPDETLTDNPMHILRSIRFAVRYGWDLDQSLIDSMKRNVAIIGQSTLNRIIKEVTAILELDNKEQALTIINDIGAMEYVRPIIEMIQTGNIPSRQKRRNHRRRRVYHGKRKRASLVALLLTLVVTVFAQPKLERKGNIAHIVANGKPMLMIGGEMGNSSASTLPDVQKHFAYLHRLGLNTVLAPVTWELIEPQEGQFDMTSLDNILTEARNNDLKVVLLWFGAWKNSMSCYAPEWFKRDTKRFPRAHTMDGKPVEEASSLSRNVLEADKKAFCHIMEYLRDHDQQQTVIMMQVENEIGMIEVPRDYSADATKLYNSAVPKSLTDYLNRNRETLHPYMKTKTGTGTKTGTKTGTGTGTKTKTKTKTGATWAEMFGDDIYTEEIFQTWTYATYVQQIAEAGRRIYDLPMYVNVALNSRNRKPGQYPSGGPLAHLIDIWHAAAPAIDVLGVDIYDKGYKDWVAKYHLPNNPLFIPEIRLEDKDAMYALYAFGHHGAMGFCPFSIEDYPLYNGNGNENDNGNGNGNGKLDLSLDDQLNAFSAKQENLSPIAACYRLLRQAEPFILERQGTKDMEGVLLTNDQRQQDIITPDGIKLTIKHSYSLGWEPGSKDAEWPEAACIIMRLGKEDYLVIGSGVVVTYSDASQKANRIGLAKCESVSIEDDKMQITRHLSGDQTHQGRHVRIPVGLFDMQHFRLYRY